ncbi:hypothetical protein ABZP36_031608 [Zizania latifolia]
MASCSSVAPNPVPPPPPPPPGDCWCPYCQHRPPWQVLRSHLRKHYGNARKARKLGTATRVHLAILRAAAIRRSRLLRTLRRRRGMMAPLFPNRAFWAAHRLRGTRPVEIDFFGDLQVQEMVPAPAPAGPPHHAAALPADDGEGDDGSSTGSNDAA